MYAGASLLPQRSLLLSPPTTASLIAISLHRPLSCSSRSSLRSPSLKLRLRSPAPSSLNPNFRPRSKWESEGVWQEPDDGYGSEYEERGGIEEEEDDEVEEEEEEDGGGEAQGAKPSRLGIAKNSIAQFDEELVKEVELLLTPEEKATLDQNGPPNLSKISTLKWHPLHSFALAGQIPFMDKLLETGTHIDSFDKDGFTPLHRAVIGKKEAVISHLLRKGANPHVRDRAEGNMCKKLKGSYEYSDLEDMQLDMSKRYICRCVYMKSSPECKRLAILQDGATPLHYAVQVGAMQTVKLLIKYKVDVNVADNEGWTPLHVAIQSRSRDIAKVLLVNGADKSRKNKDGKTPLDLSLCYGKDFKSYDLAKLLKLVPANRDP